MAVSGLICSRLRRTALLGCGAAAGALLGMPSAAHAAQSATPDAAPVPADPAHAAPPNGAPASGEIVVTAERRDARVVDTPITIAALSSSQLQSRGVTGVLDLTKVVSGLKLDQYGGSVFPAIRGITTSVSGVGVSSNVAVYLDGFYQATPTVLNFEFPDVDNVQVLKGPQGTLFGRNATGGAILLTTKDPTTHPQGEVSLGYGTYNEKVASGFASGPLADGLTASISASYRHSDGYTRNIVNGEKDGFYNGWNVRGKLKYETGDWLTLKLEADHTYINDPMSMVYRVEGNNSTGDVTPGAIVAHQPYDTSSDQPTILRRKVDGVYFTAKANLGFATLTSLTSYANEKDLFQFDFDGSSLPNTDFAYAQHVQTITQELILAGTTGRLQWSVGGFYLHQNGRMPFAAVDGFSYVDDRVLTKSYAGYVDATYNILPKLYITGGVRYSHEAKGLDYNFLDGSPEGHSSRGWNSVTPRGVVRYQFDRDTSAYASYSKGFAAGVYSPFSPTQNPVNPEKLDAYEIGFKHSQSGFSFDAAAFYYKYRDMQFVSYTVVNGETVSILKNVGRANIKGLEANVRYRVNDILSLNAGGAYTRAKYNDFQGAPSYQAVAGGGYAIVPIDASGKMLIRTPKFTGSAGFNVHYPLGAAALDFGGNFYFVSKSYDDAANELEIKQHALVDFNANLTSANGLWKLGVVAKNLLNKHYLNYWDPSGDALLVNDAPPRTVRVTLTRKF
jgi:iron complex outermembrane receptor protein